MLEEGRLSLAGTVGALLSDPTGYRILYRTEGREETYGKTMWDITGHRARRTLQKMAEPLGCWRHWQCQNEKGFLGATPKAVFEKIHEKEGSLFKAGAVPKVGSDHQYDF